MEKVLLKCPSEQYSFEYIRITPFNYEDVCEFAKGQYVTKATNPTLSQGKYFGVFLHNCLGENMAKIGDYIVKLDESNYMVFPQIAFSLLFMEPKRITI